MAPKRKFVIKEGQVFGRLTVIREEYLEKDPYHHYYLCQCSCGNTKIVRDRSLCTGETKSCGCIWKETMSDYCHRRTKESEYPIGFKQGKLTILENLGRLDGKDIYYKCKCDCGNIVNIRQYKLKGGQLGCKCVLQEKARQVHIESSRLRRKYPEYIYSLLVNEEDKQGIRDKIFPYDKKLLFRCTKCGCTVEKPISYVIKNNKGREYPSVLCDVCSPHNSLEEEEINTFLLSFLPERSIHRHRRDLIKGKDFKCKGYELDFYLPDYTLAIEYNGSYYHSENRKPKNYHLDKFKLCEEKGIRLISIFEMDWNKSKEKLKDLIKYSILPKQKIYARQCVVKYVSEKEAFSFYDTYHIQNRSILSKINLGLFYKEELVSVMGFGSSSFHNRRSEDGDYELHRFVTKAGFTVVGGASKLLKYFEQHYKPRFLLSYSWNDWYDGKLYSILGFSLDYNVTPDYYWYYNYECVNKRKCRLKNLQVKYPELYKEALENNASNKEDYVMEHLGAIKVYRSGSKRWVKSYK